MGPSDPPKTTSGSRAPLNYRWNTLALLLVRQRSDDPPGPDRPPPPPFPPFVRGLHHGRLPERRLPRPPVPGIGPTPLGMPVDRLPAHGRSIPVSVIAPTGGRRARTLGLAVIDPGSSAETTRTTSRRAPYPPCSASPWPLPGRTNPPQARMAERKASSGNEAHPQRIP